MISAVEGNGLMVEIYFYRICKHSHLTMGENGNASHEGTYWISTVVHRQYGYQSVTLSYGPKSLSLLGCWARTCADLHSPERQAPCMMMMSIAAWSFCTWCRIACGSSSTLHCSTRQSNRFGRTWSVDTIDVRRARALACGWLSFSPVDHQSGRRTQNIDRSVDWESSCSRSSHSFPSKER